MDERTKRIWRGLVTYANTPAEKIDLSDLRRTIAAYMPCDLVVEHLALDSLLMLSWPEERLREEAVNYQGGVRELLYWFTTEQGGFWSGEASDFLHDHMEHIKWHFYEVRRPQLS